MGLINKDLLIWYEFPSLLQRRANTQNVSKTPYPTGDKHTISTFVDQTHIQCTRPRRSFFKTSLPVFEHHSQPSVSVFKASKESRMWVLNINNVDFHHLFEIFYFIAKVGRFEHQQACTDISPVYTAQTNLDSTLVNLTRVSFCRVNTTNLG